MDYMKLLVVLICVLLFLALVLIAIIWWQLILECSQINEIKKRKNEEGMKKAQKKEEIVKEHVFTASHHAKNILGKGVQDGFFDREDQVVKEVMISKLQLIDFLTELEEDNANDLIKKIDNDNDYVVIENIYICNLIIEKYHFCLNQNVEKIIFSKVI